MSRKLSLSLLKKLLRLITRGCSIPCHFRINEPRPSLNATAHGECVFYPVRPQKQGSPLRTHTVVAVNHHSARFVSRQPFTRLGKCAEREPLVTGDLADGQLIGFPAINQSRPLLMRQMNPCRHLSRSDFQGFSGIGKKRRLSVHSMMTGVPTWTFAKKWVDM